MAQPPEDNLPPRFFPAHWIAAILALVGAAAIQVNWGSALHSLAIFPWHYTAAALAAATLWLLSTAWLHWQLAEYRPNPRRFWRLLPLAISDLLVACFAGLILWQGHGSRVMLAGLWLIPPVLLGVAATSLAVLLAAAANAWREPLPPDESDSRPATSDRWRTAVVLALFVALGLLNSRPLPTRVARGANVAPAGAAGR